MYKLMLAIAAASFLTQAGAAADPQFLAFAKDQAKSRNFAGCDRAIEGVFENIGGEKVNVWTDVLESSKKDELRISAVYGSSGDMVYVDAVIRRVGTQCTARRSSTIVAKESCPSYLSNNKLWRMKSSTLDMIEATNDAGVQALLREAGGTCVVVFVRDNIYKSN